MRNANMKPMPIAPVVTQTLVFRTSSNRSFVDYVKRPNADTVELLSLSDSVENSVASPAITTFNKKR